MEKWFIKSKKNEINFEDENLSKYMRMILSNREFGAADNMQSFLNPNISNLHSPILLPDLIKATNIIMQSIKKQEYIRVIGDYDVDGVTSAFILTKGLKNLGAHVDYQIPHRVNDGYGINKIIIDKASNDGVDLIITCDNGIAAIDEINYAKQLGIKVIVTDHHEVQCIDKIEQLPLADAVVDPKKTTSKYPFNGICGAVVAYKLIQQLYIINAREENELLEEFLPFAAIGTICDVMSLVDENRILVSEGLKYLNNSQNLGLRALKEACSIDGEIDVYHVGFILGPTINSSGRLESAEMALNLFFQEEYAEAISIAKNLRELNQKRQQLTEEGYNRVINIIEKYQLDEKLSVLMVKETSIDESIIGIVAGRIKEKYNRPTIIFTKSKDFLKGSGRSIEEYDMFDHMQKFRNEFLSFGGHKMACGLSLEEEKLSNLIVNINNSSNLNRGDLVRKVYIDAVVNLEEVNLKMIADLDRLRPYGNGNPKPLFVTTNLKILNFNILGKNKNVLKFDVSDGKNVRKAIIFKSIEEFLIMLNVQVSDENIKHIVENNSNILVDIVYSPVINEFKGVQNIELRISNIRISRKN